MPGGSGASGTPGGAHATDDRVDTWEIIRTDVAATVRELKRRGGRDIVLYGHGLVGEALLEAGPLDEINLWIHPVFAGSGRLLFREGPRTDLRLAATKTTGTGVVILTYEPIR